MEDRGPAAYLAEFIGTLMLVLFISLAVCLFVPGVSETNPNPFIDWSVIGLVHVFILFVLIQTLAVVSGAHFNPAVTVAMTTLRQIKPADAVIYILAQLAGAVAAALIVKLLLNNFPNAEVLNYGAVGIGERLDGKLGLGMLAEFIGTFTLVFAIMGAALDPRVDRAAGPLAIGAALGMAVMVIGPLTGAGFNPARAFGPALVSGEWGGAGDFILAYVLAPAIGAVVAALAYFRLFITPGAKSPEGLGPVG
ncbi:MAG TPA: aquaporin [Thermoleophilaceae bacterium]|nr:aquaporin [Thermoleophilaceae bacterium]